MKSCCFWHLCISQWKWDQKMPFLFDIWDPAFCTQDLQDFWKSPLSEWRQPRDTGPSGSQDTCSLQSNSHPRMPLLIRSFLNEAHNYYDENTQVSGFFFHVEVNVIWNWEMLEQLVDRGLLKEIKIFSSLRSSFHFKIILYSLNCTVSIVNIFSSTFKCYK